MSQITPERADKTLDRAVDVTQFVGIVAALVAVLTGADLVVDDNMAGWAIGAAGVVGGAVAFLVACWARSWMLRR